MVLKQKFNQEKDIYEYNFYDGKLTINKIEARDKDVFKFYKIIHNITIDVYNKKSNVFEMRKESKGKK